MSDRPQFAPDPMDRDLLPGLPDPAASLAAYVPRSVVRLYQDQNKDTPALVRSAAAVHRTLGALNYPEMVDTVLGAVGLPKFVQKTAAKFGYQDMLDRIMYRADIMEQTWDKSNEHRDRYINSLGDSKAAHDEFRGRLKTRGLNLDIDMYRLRDLTIEKLNADLGNWRGVLPADQEGRLIESAMLETAVRHATLDSGAGHEQENTHQIAARHLAPTFRDPSVLGGRARAMAEIRQLEIFTGAHENPENLGWMAYVPGIGGPRAAKLAADAIAVDDEVVNKWYTALTGAPPPASQEDKVGPIRAFLGNYQVMTERAKQALKWQHMGIDVPLNRLHQKGGLHIYELPFHREVLDRFHLLASNGLAEGDLHGHAELNARGAVSNLLANEPYKLLRQFVPEGVDVPRVDDEQLRGVGSIIQRGQVRSYDDDSRTYLEVLSKMGSDISKMTDPGDRMEYFLRTVRHLGPHFSDKYAELLGRMRGAEAIRMREDLKKVHDAEGHSPEYSESLANAAHRFQAQQLRDSEIAQEVIDKNLVAKGVFWAMNTAAAVADAVGARKLSDVTVTPYWDTLLDQTVYRHFDDLDVRYINKAGSFGEWFTNRALGFESNEAMVSRYLTKKSSGQGGLLDDAGFALNMFISGLKHLPGLMIDDPVEFAVIGKILHKYGKVRGAAINKLTAAANLSAPAKAGLQVLSNPLALGEALGTLVGGNPWVVRQMGTGMGALKRHLNNMTPEAGEAMMTWAKEYVNLLHRDPIVALSPHVGDRALAGFGAVLSKAKRQMHVSNKDVVDLARSTEGMTPDQARMLVGPLLKPRTGVDIQLNKMTFQAEHNALRAQEQAIAREGAAAFKALGETPAKLFNEAVSEYHAGRLAQWENGLVARLGRQVAPEFTQRVIEAARKRVELASRAAPLVEDTRLAMLVAERWRNGTTEAAASLEFLRNTHDLEVKSLRSQVEAKQHVVETARAAGLVGRGMVEKMRDLDSATARLREAENLDVRIRSDIARLRLLNRQSITGATERRAPGPEAGFKSSLNQAERVRLAGHIVDLMDTSPTLAADLGLNTSQISRALRRAKRGAPMKKAATSLLNDTKRFLAARKAFFLDDNPAEATKILREGKKVPKNYDVAKDLMKTGQKLIDRKIQYLDRVRNFAAREVANAWGVFGFRGVNEHYQEAIGELRNYSQVMRDLATARPDPSTTLWDLMSSVVYPWSKGRMFGLMAQRIESSFHPDKMIFDRLRTARADLSLADQRTLDSVLRGEVDRADPGVSAEIRQIAMNEGRARSSVIQMLEDIGRLTPEQARNMRSDLNAYSDRYYLAHEFGEQMRAQGYKIGHADPTSPLRPPTAGAGFARLKAQRSTRHARVFYRDWEKGGEWVEENFSVKDHGGAQGAARAAKRFIKDRLKRRLNRENEVSEVVSPITDVEMGGLGLITDVGEFRFSKIQRLMTDVAKMQMFNQMAVMGGMTRNNLSDLPARRHGEWINLEGKQFGAMSGKYVHKSLLRHINSWNNYNVVLESAGKAISEAIAKLDPALQMKEVLTGDIQQRSHMRSVLSRVDKVLRHNLIVRNVGSWVNNHMGNVTSAYLAGVNPASTPYWNYLREFDSLYEKVAEGTLTEAELKSGVTSLFMRAGQMGHWQRSARGDIPGAVELSGVSPKVRDVLKHVTKQLRRDHKAAINKVDRLEKAVTSIEWILTDPKRRPQLKPAEVEMLRTRYETFNDQLREAQSEMISRGINPDEPAIAKALARDLGRALYDPERSHISQFLADKYSRIDAQHKWAALRYLTTEKGMSEDMAIELINTHFQNFGAIHPMVRELKRMPLLGAFVPSFPAEAVRILYNSAVSDPGRLMTVATAPMIYNMGALGAQGMLPSDIPQMFSTEGELERLKAMMFNALVPTGDGKFVALNATQFTPLAPFLEATGAGRALTQWATPAMEEHMGMASVPLSMGMNYVSQFVGSTPAASLFSKFAFGVDPFTQEAYYKNLSAGEFGRGVLGELLQYATPRFLTKATSEYERWSRGPLSTITQYQQGGLTSLLRGVTGLGLRDMDRQQAIARTVLAYSSLDNLRQTYGSARGLEEMRYKQALYRVSKAQTQEELATTTKEAVELAKQLGNRTVKLGNRTFEVELTDSEATKKVIQEASRNIYSTIERLPVDKAVRLALDLSTGIGRQDDPELKHVWRTITNPVYLGSKNNPEQLLDASRAALEYSQRAADPQIRVNFAEAYQALTGRLLHVLSAASTRRFPDLLHRKMGSWPKLIREEMVRRLGLTY